MNNLLFNQVSPDLLVVDDFYKDPDQIINMARGLTFKKNLDYYKGSRTESCLLPYVKEEFERLLNVQIIDWLQQPMNGVFQSTDAADPLVYHADTQDYAAAIYLSESLGEEYGTSFWKSKKNGYRKPSNDQSINNIIFGGNNILDSEAWELVDKVGSVFNRLVIWNAKLIHSASKYDLMRERLVHLYFFNVKK